MNQQFPILWYYYVVHTSNFPSHLASKLRDAGKRSPEALLYFQNNHKVEISSTHFKCFVYFYSSMTSLLTHTVADSNRPSYRPKTNNQPIKKLLKSLAVS